MPKYGFVALAGALPDPGISVHFRLLDDDLTALHVAAQYGSLGADFCWCASGALWPPHV